MDWRFLLAGAAIGGLVAGLLGAIYGTLIGLLIGTIAVDVCRNRQPPTYRWHSLPSRPAACATIRDHAVSRDLAVKTYRNSHALRKSDLSSGLQTVRRRPE